MGVKIFDILPSKELSWKELQGKIIAVDTSLFLYQFLASIRQRDGTLLTDSKGRTTSHLVGLFSRTINWMEKGIKPVFIFDGKPPELKIQVQQLRREAKQTAMKQYETALEQGNIEDMKKFASRTSKVTPEIVAEAKELVTALGLPIIQAPSEAEAQASYMTSQGDAWAVASQDADVFVFGAERLIRNLSIAGKKKIAGKLAYTTISPELFIAQDVFNTLGIDREQLIALSILVGTDYAPMGVKGIGSKTALKIVKEYGKDFDALFKKVEWEKQCETPWKEIFDTFKDIPITKEYTIQFGTINPTRVKKILVEEHEFALERVESSLSKLITTSVSQQGLTKWF